MGAMLGKESVRSRLQREVPASSSSSSSSASAGSSSDGMSFTEFSYQTLQAYDFLHLLQPHGVKVQIGGSDQWGNIVAGTELIHRVHPETQVYGLTVPLLLTSSGEKFGKSAGNAVCLSAARTSAYALHHHFYQTSDSDVQPLLLRFTFLSVDAIATLMRQHLAAPSERRAQQVLADYVTRIAHGPEGLAAAHRTRLALFPNSTSSPPPSSSSSSSGMNADVVAALAHGAPQTEMPRSKFIGMPLPVLLREAKAAPSAAEARRVIGGGGVSLNNVRVPPTASGGADPAGAYLMSAADLHSDCCLIRIGKKSYFLVKVRD